MEGNIRRPISPPHKGLKSAPMKKFSGPPRVEKPKGLPPEQTNAENFYYSKQISQKTPMTVILRDGEELEGTLEWYDKTCIRLARSGEPAVMIYKPAIKFLYKSER